jgi:hypothetical protein
MVNSTIELRGPKRLIRRMYTLARREHDRGMPFCGLFDEASRAKVGGEHALRLSRHGYLSLGAARRELHDVLDQAATAEGIQNVDEVVELSANPRTGWMGLLPF